MRRALVLGGTGAVGSEVVRALAARGLTGAFTYLRSAERAAAVAAESGFEALQVDLADVEALRRLLAELPSTDVLVACAATGRRATLPESTVADWDAAQAVSGRATFLACQALAPGMAAAGGGSIVLVGALDRGQSLPLPVAVAASQAMLPALAMALARELGPGGTRVNAVALGPLDAGMSRILSADELQDYRQYSALRRVGTPREVVPAIVWLALDNRYMSGKVLAVNGGI